MPSGVTGPASSRRFGASPVRVIRRMRLGRVRRRGDFAASGGDPSAAPFFGGLPIAWANALASRQARSGSWSTLFHLFATSCFMNFSPSVASCVSLWYIRRQIFVAAAILSRARPKASITIRLL